MLMIDYMNIFDPCPSLVLVFLSSLLMNPSIRIYNLSMGCPLEANLSSFTNYLSYAKLTNWLISSQPRLTRNGICLRLSIILLLHYSFIWIDYLLEYMNHCSLSSSFAITIAFLRRRPATSLVLFFFSFSILATESSYSSESYSSFICFCAHFLMKNSWISTLIRYSSAEH